MNFLSFFLQANLYLVLFFGFYRLLLHNETFYNFNRIYLIGTALLAFIIPLWHSDWVQSWFITEQVQTTYSVVLQPAMIVLRKQIKPEFSWSDALLFLYIAGACLFAIRLIIKLLQLNNLSQTLMLSHNKPKHLGAFSFFKTIFVDEQLANRSTILLHEKVHANQYHSADVLLLEIIAIFCWFNPIVYFYKRVLTHIHEFIADEIAAQNEPSKAAYALLLFSQQFGTKPIELTNSFFNYSLLKQRIIMLNKPRSRRIALLKYGFSVPLFVFMLVISSASIADNTTLKKVENLIKMTDTEQPKPSIKNSKVDVTVKLNPELKAKNRHGINIENEEIYTSSVDQNPVFPNGIKNMYDWLGKHIIYPKEAIKNKIGGKIFVKFVVKRDGFIGNIQILKGIGFGCDEEAIRVIKAMPRWKAGIQNGKAVNVYFTMPIVFDLGEDDKKVGENSTEKNTDVTYYANYNISESLTDKRVKESVGIFGNESQNSTKLFDKEIKVIQPSPKDINDVIEHTSNGEKPAKVTFIIDKVKIQPLCVINGKIASDASFINLDSNDIQTFTVMQGIDAIKNYGEKGKNGVLIITTK